MRVRRNLFIGLVALSLLSGTVLAQAPQPPQGGGWDGGQIKAQALPGPEQPRKAEDNSSIGMGTWVIIGIAVLVILCLANQKPKGEPVPFPFPIPLPRDPKPRNSSGALWFWIGLGLLALIIYGCVSDKPKPVAPPPQVQPLQPVQPGQWGNNK
jgi:hypothetical protein